MPEPSTPQQHAEWNAWLAGRPPEVRRIAELYPPWPTYRLKETGQLCTIQQYDEHEDGHVTLSILAWYEWLGLPHGVFGIDPNSLERVGEAPPEGAAPA